MIPFPTPTGAAPEKLVEWYNPQNVMNFQHLMLPGLYKVE
jgi:hypothetical protein